MKTTTEKTENRQAFLTIEMEPAEVEESLESAYRRLVKRTRIPGFRKGKAPRAILERYIGKESLLEDALNNMLPEVYEKAIKDQEIEAIARPQIEIAQTDPVVFKAIVPLKPTVKLGDYRSIKVKQKPAKVTKSDVDAVMEHLRHQYAVWEPVERAVEFNDLVVMDVESSVEGQTFINQKGAQYHVLADQTFPAEGFSQQLVGLKKGDEKEFKLQLSSDYKEEELAGKEASFKVNVTEVKQENLPELTDEFAKEVDASFETVAALREKAEADMKLRAEERARMDFEEELVDAVVDLSEVEYPPILVDSEINRMINQSLQRSNLTLEDYLLRMNRTEEELVEEFRPLAEKSVVRSLVLGDVARDGKVEVSESDIDEEIENFTKDTAEDRKEELKNAFNTPQFRQSIEQNLFTRKTLQLLKDIAQDSKTAKRTRKKEGK